MRPNGSREVIKDYYDAYWSDDGFQPTGKTPEWLPEMFGQVIPPGSTCLDVGCGDGGTAGLWLTGQGHRYVGVDVSGTAVSAARSAGLDARVIDDASELPFADGSFDVTIAIEVFEHLFQPQLALAEMYRVLVPGGVLAATVPNIAYWRRRVDLALLGRWNPLGDQFSVEQPWRDPHVRFFNPGSLRRMLVRQGFHSVHVFGVEGGLLKDTPWIGRRFRRGGAVYRRVERLLPSLFGFRLCAVAYKPDPS